MYGSDLICNPVIAARTCTLSREKAHLMWMSKRSFQVAQTHWKIMLQRFPCQSAPRDKKVVIKRNTTANIFIISLRFHVLFQTVLLAILGWRDRHRKEIHSKELLYSL